MIAAGTTIADAITLVGRQLAATGIEETRLDARLLLGAATGLPGERIVLEPMRPLSAHEAQLLSGLVQRRAAREPVTRILGERAFYGRTFEVTPDTLDPRPETETLIELALELAQEKGWRNREIGILDIGTGTGCILLSLLAQLPEATGVGRDVSADALAVANRNAARLGLSDRVRWELARSMSGVVEPCDLVVSNPPYIPAADIAGLEPEVREHDPRLALDGGADGLDIISEIVAGSVGLAETWFAVEFGAGQADAVVRLIRQACGAATAGNARLRRDLGGHTRCVAWKPQS